MDVTQGVEGSVSPMGFEWLDLVSLRAAETTAQTLQWVNDTPMIQRRLRIIGNFHSIVQRAGSCWWGCSHTRNHELESLAAANASAGAAALMLTRIGHYDEAVASVRTIAERVNLYALFFAAEDEFRQWVLTPHESRWKRFGPSAVRKRIEGHDAPPPYAQADYQGLSSRGLHPGSRTQQHTPGMVRGYSYGAFQEQGARICIDQIVLALYWAAHFGPLILTHLTTELRQEISDYVRAQIDEVLADGDLIGSVNLPDRPQ